MKTGQLPDKHLLTVALTLLLFGWIISFSASLAHFDSYQYFFKHSLFIVLGLSAGFILLKQPIALLKKYSPMLFVITLILLAVVFLPSPIGHTVNGSTRWINLVVFKFQPSEMMKLAMILFMAGFLIRQEEDIRKPWMGFFKTLIIISSAGILLLLETDFGATLIILITALSMLFVAGAYLKQLGIVSTLLAGIIGALIFLNPNRWERLISFWNTDLWQNHSDKVYQTKQALIAIARGDWTGTGLGAGIQKYSKLPEPHTDMIFSIIGEELGVIGMFFVLCAFGYIIGKGFNIAQVALKDGRKYSSYVAFGIATWFSMQISVNIAMNLALIPPKGFTLPLVSYGGSSLIFAIIALAVLLRIDMENNAGYDRQKQYV